VIKLDHRIVSSVFRRAKEMLFLFRNLAAVAFVLGFEGKARRGWLSWRASTFEQGRDVPHGPSQKQH